MKIRKGGNLKNFPFITVFFTGVLFLFFMIQIYFPEKWVLMVKKGAFSPFSFSQNFPSLTVLMTLFSYPLFHFNAYHLFSNLFLFFTFGVLLESGFRKSFYLVLLFLSIVIPVLVQFFFNSYLKVYIIGSSSIVATFAGVTVLKLFYGKIKSRILIVFYSMIFFMWLYSQFHRFSGQTAWVAHIAGFCVGVIFFLFTEKSN